MRRGSIMSIINRKVCIMGQGFVGLPLALSFALRGCSVIGVDVDELLIDSINKGITHHSEKFHGETIQEILNSQIQEDRYIASTDAQESIRACNNIVVTVGIPIENDNFVMDYLRNCCSIIGKNLKKMI